jgi:hypothetical protein
MATGSLALAIFALVIAAIAVVGGVVELLMQRVVVDKESGQVVEVQIPLFGNFKSNYPSLGPVFLGVALVFAVLQWAQVEKDQIPLTATVTLLPSDSSARKTADVFVSAVPARYRQAQSKVTVNEPVKLRLNVDSDERYDVIVYVPLRINEDGSTERVLTFGPMDLDTDGGIFNAELQLR